MEAIVIPQRENFNRRKQLLIKGGSIKLQVVTDFDRTLTTNFVNGRKLSSLVAALSDHHYLTADYAAKAQALFDYYRPLESDISLSLEAKKSLMTEWWRRHFDLLIASGLNLTDIKNVVDEKLVNLRTGAAEFIKLLSKFNIPLLIFSANGLGVSALAYFFQKEGLAADNLHFIANDFVWSEDGRALSVKEPIIHSFNKDETELSVFGCWEKVRDRNNILLFGDSLGDVGMANGFPYRNLLKIGFLNDKIRESLPAYREVYDALILNDGDFSLPLELLKEIINYAD